MPLTYIIDPIVSDGKCSTGQNKITYLGDASLNQVGWKHIPATGRKRNEVQVNV
jgi:hypothetical protein